MPDEAGEKTSLGLQPIAMPPIAFTVAITGHRTLPDDMAAAMERAVQTQLATARNAIEALKATSLLDADRVLDLRFLSALAAGADQIGARAALAQSDAGWHLHAVLPFAEDAYRETMVAHERPDDVGRAEFDRLLPLATRRFTLADWATGPWDGRDGTIRYWRDRRFRTLGQLLVRQSDLLIAIWRGDPPGGGGGTAEVVGEALRVGTPVIWIDAQDGRIYGLPGLAVGDNPVALAQRIRGSDGVRAAFSPDAVIDTAVRAVLAPVERKADESSASSRRASLTAFVHHPQTGAPERVRARSWASFYQHCAWIALWFGWVEDENSEAGGRRRLVGWPGFRLVTDQAHRALDADRYGGARGEIDRVLAPTIGAADAIATRLGHLYRSAYSAIFLLAALAVGIGLVGGFWHEEKPYFVAAELGVLLAVLAIYRMARAWCWHQRWLNGRHLAESLRGIRLLAWVGFGGRRPADPDAPWSAWLSNSVAALPGTPSGEIGAPEITRIAEAAVAVVDSQRDYHWLNHHRLERLHRRLDMLGWLFVGVAAMVAFAFVIYALIEPGELVDWSLAAVTLAGGWCPAVAAALAGIRFQGDFERFAKRSEETKATLVRLKARLGAIADRAAAAPGGCSGREAPLYEELLTTLLAIQEAFEKDLEDWRFVYADRPTPGL